MELQGSCESNKGGKHWRKRASSVACGHCAWEKAAVVLRGEEKRAKEPEAGFYNCVSGLPCDSKKSLDECDEVVTVVVLCPPSRVAGMRGATYLGVDLVVRMQRHD